MAEDIGERLRGGGGDVSGEVEAEKCEAVAVTPVTDVGMGLLVIHVGGRQRELRRSNGVDIKSNKEP